MPTLCNVAGHVAYGTVTGTGSAISVTVGFQPQYVKLCNITGNCQMEWFQGMGNAYGQKIVDSGVGTTDISTVSSGGIIPAATGFSIGTDSDLNVNTEVIYWLAIGD